MNGSGQYHQIPGFPAAPTSSSAAEYSVHAQPSTSGHGVRRAPGYHEMMYAPFPTQPVQLTAISHPSTSSQFPSIQQVPPVPCGLVDIDPDMLERLPVCQLPDGQQVVPVQWVQYGEQMVLVPVQEPVELSTSPGGTQRAFVLETPPEDAPNSNESTSMACLHDADGNCTSVGLPQEMFDQLRSGNVDQVHFNGKIVDVIYEQPLSSDPQQERSASTANDPTYYVNPKQYERIVKRREAREKMAAEFGEPGKTARYNYLSRHLHAMKRKRDESGKFSGNLPRESSDGNGPGSRKVAAETCAIQEPTTYQPIRIACTSTMVPLPPPSSAPQSIVHLPPTTYRPPIDASQPSTSSGWNMIPSMSGVEFPSTPQRPSQFPATGGGRGTPVLSNQRTPTEEGSNGDSSPKRAPTKLSKEYRMEVPEADGGQPTVVIRRDSSGNVKTLISPVNLAEPLRMPSYKGKRPVSTYRASSAEIAAERSKLVTAESGAQFVPVSHLKRPRKESDADV